MMNGANVDVRYVKDSCCGGSGGGDGRTLTVEDWKTNCGKRKVKVCRWGYIFVQGNRQVK